MMEQSRRELGGWKAPCQPFDYGKMEREAKRECAILKKRLDVLKNQRGKDAESELVRRREVCMLTDIYYEQRHQAELFRKRAAKKDSFPCHFPPDVIS